MERNFKRLKEDAVGTGVKKTEQGQAPKMRHYVIETLNHRGFHFDPSGGIQSLKREHEIFVIENKVLVSKDEDEEHVYADKKKLVHRSSITIISKVDAIKVSIPVYKGSWRPIYERSWDQDGTNYLEDLQGMEFVGEAVDLSVKIVFTS